MTVSDVDLVTKNADGRFIPLKPPYKSLSSPGPDEAIVAVWIQGYIRGIYRAEYPNPRVKLYKDARGAHLMGLFERKFYPVDELIELPASITAPRSGSGQTSRRNGRPSRGRGRSRSETGPSSSRKGPLSSGDGPSLNRNGSSTSETGPSSSRSAPSSSEYGPSSSGNGPSTSGRSPSSSENGPSSSGKGPSPSESEPSSSGYGPSTSESGPPSRRKQVRQKKM